MKLATKLFVARLPLIMLLILAAFAVAACDVTSSPDDENTNFDGPPIVRIAAPITGDTYREGVGVDVLIRIENAGPDIARIAIQVDGINVGEAILPNESGAPSFTIRNSWTATGVGSHQLTVLASRADSSQNASASVTINVVAAPQTVPQAQATNTTAPVNNAQPSNTPADTNNTGFNQPTQDTSGQVAATNTVAAAAPATQAPTNTQSPPTATFTPSRPTATITQGANVRSGPGLVFDPPIGSLAAGTITNILAVNPAGTWYKIQFYNSEAWISAQVVTVSGDIATLPRDAGPATPVPFTPVPTSPPASATSTSTVDLIIDGANTSIVPAPFRCGRSSEVRVTVVNAGTSPSPATIVLVTDTQPNGSVGATTQGPVPALQPNQSALIVMYLTVSTFVNEGHTFRAIVDGNNTVPETNESNNTNEYVYVLASGTC